jgi:hypothetical protein
MENEHQKIWGTPKDKKEVKLNPELVNAPFWHYPLATVLIGLLEPSIGYLMGYYFLPDLSDNAFLAFIFIFQFAVRVFLGYLIFIKIFNKTNTKTAFYWLLGLSWIGYLNSSKAKEFLAPLGMSPEVFEGILSVSLIAALICLFAIFFSKNKERWQ